MWAHNHISGFSFTKHTQITGQKEKEEANFNPSLPLPQTTKALKVSQVITGERSTLHRTSEQFRTGILFFQHKLLTTELHVLNYISQINSHDSHDFIIWWWKISYWIIHQWMVFSWTIFPARTVLGDFQHHKPATRPEQYLNFHRTWVQDLMSQLNQEMWYVISIINFYTNNLLATFCETLNRYSSIKNHTI